MAHITRCPRCHTAFRVYPDQLRIASGQVRCGHCGHVFDAPAHVLGADAGAEETTAGSGHAAGAGSVSRPSPPIPVWPTLFGEPLEQLHESPAVPNALEAPTSGPTKGAATSAIAVERAPTPTSVEAPAGSLWAPEPTPGTPTTPAFTPAAAPVTGARNLAPPLEQPTGSASQAGPVSADDHGWRAGRDHAPFDLSAATPADRTDMAASARGPLAAAGSAPRDDAVEPVIDIASPSVDGDAPWAPRPAAPTPARTGWAILAVLLALLLVAQGIFWQRGWVAARWPITAPALRLLCAPLQCDVPPYRQLSAIAIADSNFKALTPGANAYQLELTLHNRARLAVGVPNLELTLTSNDGQVLVRRILTPEELGAPPALAADASVPMTRRIQITEPLPAGPVANYRLTAFYP